MPSPYILTASILSADFTHLGQDIKEAEQGGIDWIHVDVMDGHFVPNLTMGPFVVEACRRVTQLPIDVHLMVEKPENLLAAFAHAGANIIYVHIETCPNVYQTIQTIHDLGCKAGIAISPGTQPLMIEPVLHLVELVLVMTVNPGYSGQAFMPITLPKISQIRQMLDIINPQAMIAVDGGITPETLSNSLKAGAQVFITATAVFKHRDKDHTSIADGIRSLRECFPR